MNKKKVIYIGILFIITVIVSITAFSYAYLTKIDEQHGKLNMTVGSLDYKIESDDLNNNSITLSANESKEIELTIRSLNKIDSKYKLYTNSVENVSIGYLDEEGFDESTGIVESNGTVKVKIVLENDSDTSKTITFGVQGGFDYNEVALETGRVEITEGEGLCATGDTYVFDYTGNIQEFRAKCSGIYKIEAWGAQGGYSVSNTNDYLGGKGSYVSGEIELDKNEMLNVVVGGSGTSCSCSTSINCCGNNGGYNGGGNTLQYTQGTTYYGSGGGATDIRYNGTTLNDRILVAAGGGGASNWTGYNFTGGPGGTLEGLYGTYTKKDRDNYCTGGTQTAAGTGTYNSGSGFGQGGISSGYIGPGGGGGYYGGGTSETYSCGGSSYISGMLGYLAVSSKTSTTPKSGCSTNSMSVACSYHYSGKIFTSTQAYSGNESMPTHNGNSTMVGNSGNGYVKITLVSTDKNKIDNNRTWDYAFKNRAQSFIAPVTGKYKIELWGAQGGYSVSNTANYLGGYGGYTKGVIELEKNTALNIVVGGSGQSCSCHSEKTCCGNNGGYNGGGKTLQYTGSNTYYGSGGGATDVRLTSTLNSRIMVAGGGGGASYYTAYNFIGGTSGGLTGNIGTYTKTDRTLNCTGGSQVSGGTGTTNYSAGSGFGQGAYPGNIYGPGGGGGYYGGGTSETYSCGGSSYISGKEGSLAVTSELSTALKSGCTSTSTTFECSKHYSNLYFTETEMIDGSGCVWNTSKLSTCSGQPQPNGTIATGHSGNGYARITYIGD